MIQETFPLTNAQGLDPMVPVIHRAVEGDRAATSQLVAVLTPVIRSSAASVLARVGGAGRREGRQEVEDAVQSVLMALFADHGRVLLQWDPARGLKLESFVALLAKREVLSLLRSRRRNPWTEDPTLNEDLDRNAVPRMGPESETISRDMLAALAIAVQSKLTPKGAELFDLLFIKGLPPEEVCAATGLSPDAVYAWRSRLSRDVRKIIAELGSGPGSVRPPPREPPPRARRSTPRSNEIIPGPRDSGPTPPPVSGPTAPPISGASLPARADDDASQPGLETYQGVTGARRKPRAPAEASRRKVGG
jgi:RNA polymerase sigma factor (sigma-70 family)